MVCPLLISDKRFPRACVAGSSSSREVAEAEQHQRFQKWEPAQRVPVRGNELVTLQLVQPVSAALAHALVYI